MRCLSVQQPWAWAIVRGWKAEENRTWRARAAGPLAIHATRPASVAEEEAGLAAIAAATGRRPAHVEADYDRVIGAVVGVVDLMGCLRVDDVAEGGPRDTLWVRGPWVWLLGGARAFDQPIPMPGRPGFWDAPGVEARPAPLWIVVPAFEGDLRGAAADRGWLCYRAETADEARQAAVEAGIGPGAIHDVSPAQESHLQRLLREAMGASMPARGR